MKITQYFTEVWSKYFEPKSDPLCKETRELLKECVAKSPCYTKTGDFKRCMQEDIDPECISLRKQYSRCKRSSIDRTRDFRSEDRYK
jgi:hypothetical protein